MKVNTSSTVANTGAARAPSRPDAGGFSLSDAQGAADAAPSAPAMAASAIGSLDALIALQEVGGPLERRRKAVFRAGRILDVLDDIKMALLDGGASPDALKRLVEAVRQERGEADSPKLQAVLDEVETRAAVELAKLETARAAA